MLDLDLRNALVAKTALRDSHVTKLGLLKTSIEEAQTLKSGKNLGHRHHDVILDRSLKIFKNLLKRYSTKMLIKNFVDFDTNRYHLKTKGESLNRKSNKQDIINAIAGTAKYTIKLMLSKGENESTNT